MFYISYVQCNPNIQGGRAYWWVLVGGSMSEPFDCSAKILERCVVISGCWNFYFLPCLTHSVRRPMAAYAFSLRCRIAGRPNSYRGTKWGYWVLVSKVSI